MPKIAICCIGSRGDVQPFVALGVFLKNEGHEIVIGAQPEYRGFVESFGLRYAEIKGSMEAALRDTEAGRALVDNPSVFKVFSLTKELLLHLMDDWCRDWETLLASEPFDLAILTTIGCTTGLNACEKHGVAYVVASTVPLHPTREFAPPTLPPNGWRFMNHVKWSMGEKMAWGKFYGETVNKHRESLGLSPITAEIGPYAIHRANKVPHMYIYSPTLLPKPDDWPEEHTVTGPWILPASATASTSTQAQSEYQPPEELARFIHSAERNADGVASPLVYVGFGSMTGCMMNEAKRLTFMQNLVKAVEKSGPRVHAIIATHGASDEILSSVQSSMNSALKDRVYFMRTSVPHDWLFKKVSCVVHHGGAGTTQAALDNGRPSVFVPFGSDQPFWADRVEKLGAAAPAIPFKDLTADKLASAISKVLAHPEMAKKAQEIGDLVRADNGVETAAEVVRKALRDAGKMRR